VIVVDSGGHRMTTSRYLLTQTVAQGFHSLPMEKGMRKQIDRSFSVFVRIESDLRGLSLGWWRSGCRAEDI
jgi:hypothetical protein